MPDAGVALETGKSVVFLDLEGKLVEELRGFGVAGNPGAPGVWLQRGRTYFLLKPGRDVLLPVSREKARSRMYDEGHEPKLSPPAGTRVKGDVVGHWRYAYTSSNNLILAQWSGECEVPHAYWKALGDDPEIITGGHDLSKAPESVALGWSPAGEAIVALREGLCGLGGDPPGIYAFSSPGAGRLLFRTLRGAGADMWGQG